MRDRRRQRPVARAAPVAYYVSIPRREGRAQYFDTVVCADGLRRLANYRKKWDQVRGVVVVGTERGAEAYAMRDFEPTPSGGKIG